MHGRARVRQRAYNDLRSKTVVQVTDTDIDALKSGLFAQGGRNESEYAALEKIERMSGQSSSSGYLLGTLTAEDGQFVPDFPKRLIQFPSTPRANYKIEKLGLIGSFIDTTATYRISLTVELDGKDVVILAEDFTSNYASNNFSFDLNVVLPQGADVECKIVASTSPGTVPVFDAGIIYGRVR